VPSLADALRMAKQQAERTPPPQWVRVVGAWSEFQVHHFGGARGAASRASGEPPAVVGHHHKVILGERGPWTLGCGCAAI
jgi:predicted amidohydrolase YtcJ